MRRARNKQHAQVLANALDQRDRVIVGGGDLAVELIDGELDDVLAAPWQIEIKRCLLTGDGSFGCDLVAIDPDGDIYRSAW
jgi:hypothetical protein